MRWCWLPLIEQRSGSPYKHLFSFRAMIIGGVLIQKRNDKLNKTACAMWVVSLALFLTLSPLSSLPSLCFLFVGFLELSPPQRRGQLCSHLHIFLPNGDPFPPAPLIYKIFPCKSKFATWLVIKTHHNWH